MPWKIEQREEKYVVVKESDGEVVGTHATRAKAQAQLRALYASESKSGMRNNKADRHTIREIRSLARQIHDHTVTLEPEDTESGNVEQELITDELTGKALDLSYAKRLGIEVPDLAVKSVGVDEIKGYTFLWGNPALTDVEQEYFTKETDFWDGLLGTAPRPLTWDHAQDEEFKATPVIGQITAWGDDDIGRWYTARLERSHKYRKMIDKLIEQGVLGTSSDSAPQYVVREQRGKSVWLKQWPWFASALTDVPAEPRMIGSLEVLKSYGVVLPDTFETFTQAWHYDIAKLTIASIRR